MRKRLIASFIIILTAGAVSFAIATSQAENPPNSSEKIKAELKNSLLSFKSGEANAGPAAAGTSSAAQGDVNVTKAVADMISAKIVQNNPGGGKTTPTGKSGVEVPNLSEVEINEEYAQRLNNQILTIEPATPNDLNVVEDNSIDSQIKYINRMGKAEEENLGNIDTNIYVMLRELMVENNPSSLQNYVSSAREQLNDLIAMEAPSSWTEFHLENINLWKKKIKLFSAILNTQEDPLKGWVAFRKVGKVIKDTSQLRQKMIEKLKKLNQQRSSDE